MHDNGMLLANLQVEKRHNARCALLLYHPNNAAQQSRVRVWLHWMQLMGLWEKMLATC